ncbi:MAG: hypothetical protein A2506_07310 [Elusimicrobia bacterium RIFOXYD12_FULL_66_9]|nr:MAG: hypothetical protein A2506_07310 [Elusimicrobia bacterium RIFOXYD12_FULL_66_9]
MPPADGLPLTLSTSAIVPTYITLAPTIHDYNRFADGGPDANWYVGFSNAWIVKLPPAPEGEFARAFIGARVGRAKTRANPEKPWIRETIPGKAYIGLSQTPAWTSEQSFFLADSGEIPAEPDLQSSVEGVGAAEWFWAEVPMAMVSFTRPNYLIVWSPTNYMTRASSAAILAGADVEEASSVRDARAWNTRSTMGVPPRSTVTSLETPITNIMPALALKLVPPGPDEPAVTISDLTLARAGRRIVARFSAAGEDVTEAWVESSRDRLDWERVSKRQRRPPYVFSIDKNLPPGLWLRGAARDISGALGYSDPSMIPYALRP